MFRKLLIWSAAGAAIVNNSLVNGAQTDTDPINRDMDCCIPYSTYAIINDKMDNHISLTVQPMDENDCDSFNYVTRDNSKTARGSSPFTMLFDEVGVNQSPSNPNCAKEFSDNKVSQIATNKEDCRITKNSIEKGKGFTTLNTKEPWKEAQNRMALTIALSDPQPKPLCDQSSVLGRAQSAANFFYHFLTPKAEEANQQNNQQAGMALGG